MALDIATIRRIARLARIRVPEEDLSALAEELSRIMSWIEQLNTVDTSNIEPMTCVGDVRMSQREDKVTDGGDPEKVLANAPDRQGNFFAVPKVVE